MNKKVTSIVGYIGIIGWVIAFFCGDKDAAKFHLNQALAILIIGELLEIVSIVPIAGTVLATIISIVLLVFRIMGIVFACQDQDKEIPLFGKINIMN